MAWKKYNKLWQQRIKHGRNRKYTPETLWESALAYFKWCDKNPWIKTEYKGSPPAKVEIPIARPYTWEGLNLHLGVSKDYFGQLKKNLKEEDEHYDDFLGVIEAIRDIMDAQKLEGAMVGAFNSNIVARYMGLKDRTDITSDDEKIDQVYKYTDPESGETKEIKF